eukprot:TRINITY_DN2129_c0_g1_i1.p1 TRINITY_DN2129_c0_g1~~TRINITY_DN2129_c0_g1_i1.p1  ORF type:complete len:406 (+),score=94.98 TRINITY_DN2129_c0_g1_i1:78-1220(+)
MHRLLSTVNGWKMKMMKKGESDARSVPIQIQPKQYCLYQFLLDRLHIRRILPFGFPTICPVRIRKSYVAGVDMAKKIPFFVAEAYSSSLLKALESRNASRNKCRFVADPTVPDKYAAKNEDYLRSGLSRGHMAPAGAQKTMSEMQDSFNLTTNILPQDFDCNAFLWRRLEHWTKEISVNHQGVYVISGPIFRPQEGTNCVEYQVIGKGRVAVPTHLFKVILTKDKKSWYSRAKYSMAAYVVPNAPIVISTPLNEIEVSIDSLEEQTGMYFHPKLDRSRVVMHLQDQEPAAMDPQHIEWASKDIQYARSLWFLKMLEERYQRQGLMKDGTVQMAMKQQKKKLNWNARKKVVSYFLPTSVKDAIYVCGSIAACVAGGWYYGN